MASIFEALIKMNYSSTLEYLFTRLPMFSKQGAAAYKEDLHNTIELCNYLGNPQEKIKCIHIAGTNGKGSTSHMLAAILQTAGYKTGLYTSPHLKDFRERIKINGEMCSKEFVVDFTTQLLPLIEKIEPSFFEITVAMAFNYFEKNKVDIAIIETGLGGRLDSTNIINPLLSIITNIGWDHMNLLGNSLESIAAEKAGIIKEKTPVIISEYTNLTKKIFDSTAIANNAPIIYASDLWQIENVITDNHQIKISLKKNQKAYNYALDLPGLYQTKNITGVLEAVEQLRQISWIISEEHIQFALANTKKINGLHGRWEVLQNNPLIIADVGHNEDGIKAINQQLQQTAYSQLHIIIGMVKDKEIDKALQLLPITANYYFTQAQIPRALPANDLQTIAASNQLSGVCFSDVNTAIDAAKKVAALNDLILICGSIFLIAEINEMPI